MKRKMEDKTLRERMSFNRLCTLSSDRWIRLDYSTAREAMKYDRVFNFDIETSRRIDPPFSVLIAEPDSGDETEYYGIGRSKFEPPWDELKRLVDSGINLLEALNMTLIGR
jgi:hypothetical protein